MFLCKDGLSGDVSRDNLVPAFLQPPKLSKWPMSCLEKPEPGVPKSYCDLRLHNDSIFYKQKPPDRWTLRAGSGVYDIKQESDNGRIFAGFMHAELLVYYPVRLFQAVGSPAFKTSGVCGWICQPQSAFDEHPRMRSVYQGIVADSCNGI